VEERIKVNNIMKKIFALSFLVLLFSCKPIIFPYKPIENNLVKEGDFYYLTKGSSRIGYYPRVWINPKAGIECDIILEGIKVNSIKSIEILDKTNTRIIEIRQDSIKTLYNPKQNQIKLTQVEKGNTIKKESLKKIDSIRINININDSYFSVMFGVIEETIN